MRDKTDVKLYDVNGMDMSKGSKDIVAYTNTSRASTHMAENLVMSIMEHLEALGITFFCSQAVHKRCDLAQEHF